MLQGHIANIRSRYEMGLDRARQISRLPSGSPIHRDVGYHCQLGQKLRMLLAQNSWYCQFRLLHGGRRSQHLRALPMFQQVKVKAQNLQPLNLLVQS